MLKNLVESSFQRATVAQDYDEIGVSVARMRGQLNELRLTLREVIQETERLRVEVRELGSLRAEIAALRAGGLVVPTNGHAPSPAPPAIAVPVAVLDAAPAPTPAPATPSISAAIARDALGEGPRAVEPAEGPVRTAADGKPYWGPIDNASARAKAAGHLLIIDQPECIACGTCVEQTDLVFILPDDGKAVPKQQEGPMDAIQDAIDACPVTCIHWTEDPQRFEQLNDADGKKVA